MLSLFAAYFHEISLFCAFMFPFLGGAHRRWKGASPVFKKGKVAVDFANGLALPTFTGVIFSFLDHSILNVIDHHALVIAGVVTGAGVVKEMLSG